jgi:hypothetical protein
MLVIFWLGALLVASGVLLIVGPPIWRARLSGRRSRSATAAAGTLEPRRPGAGFGLKRNWPGLALVALGAILLLVGAAVQTPPN